jgi:hypothetical protein
MNSVLDLYLKVSVAGGFAGLPGFPLRGPDDQDQAGADQELRSQLWKVGFLLKAADVESHYRPRSTLLTSYDEAPRKTSDGR